MVYGGQRDGVRGRPVRKHRVYTGPRTVTGLLHLVELSSAVPRLRVLTSVRDFTVKPLKHFTF